MLTEFNWALHHFDAMARDNHAAALWVVGEDGSETRHSFAGLSVRSSQEANFMRDDYILS